MKVKEARERMDSLERLCKNVVKIQDYCMHNSEAKTTVHRLEEETNINTTLRNFATSVACLAADERKRIADIIDNADVKIN